MTRSIGRLGDRMLAALVPRTTASACFPTQRWIEHKSPSVCRHCQSYCSGASACDAWAHYKDC